MYDLIIIGSGPAGLTAAVYALRKSLNFLVLSSDLGGKTNYRLELPSIRRRPAITGDAIVKGFLNELESLDFTRVIATVQQIDQCPSGYNVQVQGGEVFAGRTLVIATGANARALNVPGESEYLMRGLGYSALSFAPLFVEQSAIVVGDTASALQATADLARYAHHVTLVAPSHGELDTILGTHVQHLQNVTLLEGYHVTRVKGNGYAHGVIVSNSSDEHELSADGIFVELGLVPNSDFVAHLVARDDAGRILIDPRNRTSAPGIFAAGDVTNAYAEQVLIAVGEGAKAALSAYEYVLMPL